MSNDALSAGAALVKHGRLSSGDIISALPSLDEWSASGLLRDVAPHLDDASLVRVAEAAQARGLETGHLVAALLRRGEWKRALAYEPATEWALFQLLPLALTLESKKGRGTWVAKGKAVLRRLLKEERAAPPDRDLFETGTLVLLSGAKVLVPHLAAATRKRLLTHLDGQVMREAEAGCYDELDYPYGTIDPVLELARAWAAAGDGARVARHLEERSARCAFFLNTEEIEEAVSVVEQLSAARRRHWWPKLREWARATDAESGGAEHPTEAIWLLSVLTGRRLDAELRGMIDRGAGSLALSRMLLSDRPSKKLRAEAIELLVDEMTKNAKGLPKRQNDHAGMRCEGAFRAAAATFAVVAEELSDEQAAVVGKAAGLWNAWLKKRTPTGAAIPVGIALVSRWRDEIPDALERLRRMPPKQLARCEGWERLFTDQGVAGVLKQLQK